MGVVAVIATVTTGVMMATFRHLKTGWQARVYRDGRQVTLGTFPNKGMAQKAARAAEVDIARGTFVPPMRLTLAEFLEEWLLFMSGQVRVSTWMSYKDKLTHVSQRLGGVRLSRLDATRLNALYAELMLSGRRNGIGGLAPMSIRHIHRVLHHALKCAVRWGYLPLNPCDLVDPPTVTSNKPAFWDPDALHKFLCAISDHRLACAFRLAVYTGMRRGEVAGLTWDRVDLAREQIVVCETRVMAGREVSVEKPKTKGSERTIPLDPGTVEALRRHRRAQAAEQLAAPEWFDSGHVFTRADGRAIHPQYLYVLMQRVAVQAGLQPISFHGLRHSHATAALEAGADVRVVAERLGHESTRTTQDLYQHVPKALARNVAIQVAAFLDLAAGGSE